MASYVEYIKVGTGETWQVRDSDAQQSIRMMNEILTLMDETLNSMSDEIDTLKNSAEEEEHDHPYLPIEGGTLTGPLVLTLDVHYGDTLPAAGTPGRIFLKKVSS